MEGDIIMAQPFMDDPYFKDAVILITEHSEENGSVGFIFNKSLKVQIKEVMEDFPDFDVPLLYGGPVQRDTLHFIHRCGHILEESIEIGENLYWGGNFRQLRVLIREKLITPLDIRFFLGYSGWSPGQLEEEFETGTWLHSELDINYLFNTKIYDVWPLAVSDLGGNFEVIANIPKYFSWN